MTTADARHGVLAGYTVVSLATEVAGPYCTKLLRDLGARIVKLEPPGGATLRDWGPFRPGAETDDGGLYTYLNDGAERVAIDFGSGPATEILAPFLTDADILVEDLGAGRLEALGIDVDDLRVRHSSLILVRISDQGQTGPHCELPMTPLVRQAASGWLTAPRATGREPVQVGGRIPEYVGGAYAALAALTALRQRQRSGVAASVDLSLLEAEIASLSYPMLMHEISSARGTARPSAAAGAMLGVVRCKDGWIGINALTGQHWLDICAMCEVPEFDEHQVAIMFGGAERAQFFEAVQPWLDERNAEELLELCQAMRIPAAPVGTGETMPSLAQFAARGFYRTDTEGRVTPRNPFRLTRSEPRPRPVDSARRSGPESMPFEDIRVLDLSSFWAGAYVGCYLGAFGADVVKVESIQRPDGFRYSGVFPFDGDDWYERGGLWQGGNLNKRNVTLDLTRDEGRDVLRRLIATADVLIENFSPRVMGNFGLTSDVLLQLKPDLIVLRLPGFGLEGPWANYVGWAYGIEQTAGMAWVTGYSDGPPLNPGGPADPIVGVHASIALLGALEQRRRTGEGQLVEIAQIEVAAAITAEQVLVYSMTGEVQGREGNRQRDLVQGVYPAVDANDEPAWIAVSIRDDKDWQQLLPLIEPAATPPATDLSTTAKRRQHHDVVDQMIAAWTTGRRADDVVAKLHDAGVPAAVALVPARMYDEPQLAARHFYTALDHARSGVRRYPGWPMRFEPGPAAHHRTGCPTLGQHNDEILRGELGLDEEEIAMLRQHNIIGEQPLGL